MIVNKQLNGITRLTCCSNGYSSNGKLVRYQWAFEPGSAGTTVIVRANGRTVLRTSLTKVDLETLLANFKGRE